MDVLVAVVLGYEDNGAVSRATGDRSLRCLVVEHYADLGHRPHSAGTREVEKHLYPVRFAERFPGRWLREIGVEVTDYVRSYLVHALRSVRLPVGWLVQLGSGDAAPAHVAAGASDGQNTPKASYAVELL